MTIKAVGFIIIFCLTIPFGVSAQQADSLTIKSDWSSFALGLRTGVGYQKTIFTEFGLSYHRAGGNIMGPKGQCFYSSLEWIPKVLPVKKDNIYSLKLGYEHTSHLLVYALEGRYSTNFNEESKVFITPKIGFGLWGMINILYGYNIGLSNKEQLKNIGNHQFSVVVNVDRLLIGGF